MRAAVLILPISIVVLAAGCIAVGWLLHVSLIRPVAWSALVGIIACEAAMVPLFLVRHASQVARVQAALAATIVHLFVALGLGTLLLFVLKLGPAYLFWLMGFYGLTLVAVTVMSIRVAKPASTDRVP